MRLAVIGFCSGALVLAIAALSQAPYTPPGSSDAMLRFSWRMNVKAEETCRPRTQAELDGLPVHMRTPEVCTVDSASYAIVLRIDALAPDTIHLIRGGLKGDCPLFVLEDRTLSPGEHHVRVKLVRVARSGVKVLASFDTTLEAAPGTIQLITLDHNGDRLVARSPRAHRRGGHGRDEL